MLYEISADTPLVVEDPDSGDLICDPMGVKSATTQYFQHLFHHTPSLVTIKPWLDSPAVQDVCNHVTAFPFQWPQPMSLDELWTLLR